MNASRRFVFPVLSFRFWPVTVHVKGQTVESKQETRASHEPQARATINIRLIRLAPRVARPTPNVARLLLLLIVALASLSAAPVDKKPKRQRIIVSTQLDQTAVWVGDVFRYTVRAVHDTDIDVVADSLKKENLNLAPFVVRDVTIRQAPFGENKRVTEVVLQLATYESGQNELRIPTFPLYYFTHKAAVEKSGETLAESVSVPASKIGLRSTLAGDNLRPRDARILSQDNVRRWMVALALGSVGMLFLAVQAVRTLWASSATEKPVRRSPTRRARRRMVREFLRAINSVGRDSTADQLRYYAELSRFMREYLGHSLETEVASLTPDEIARALESRGHNGLGAPVKNILERCEQVLYTRDGAELGKAWRDEVQAEVGKLLHRL
jgi:hypothetical protein